MSSRRPTISLADLVRGEISAQQPAHLLWAEKLQSAHDRTIGSQASKLPFIAANNPYLHICHSLIGWLSLCFSFGSPTREEGGGGTPGASKCRKNSITGDIGGSEVLVDVGGSPPEDSERGQDIKRTPKHTRWFQHPCDVLSIYDKPS